MSCPCCNSGNILYAPARLAPFVANRLYHREDVGCWSMQCRDCGMLFSSVRFTDAQVNRLYAGYRDEKYNAERMRYEPEYMTRLEPMRHGYLPEIEAFLSPHLYPPFDILDWGGGDGSNTPFKEVTPEIYDVATQPHRPHGKYDLVVCSNLLEHAPYPLDLLEAIKPHIGEILYLEIPMGKMTPDDYLHKTEWHEHINFFTEASISELLKRAGLRIIDIHTHDLAGTKYYTHLLMLICKPT